MVGGVNSLLAYLTVPSINILEKKLSVNFLTFLEVCCQISNLLKVTFFELNWLSFERLLNLKRLVF